jgi:hypothetical protein
MDDRQRSARLALGCSMVRANTAGGLYACVQLQLEERTTSMVWKVKSIIHRTTPAREREQTCATEAEFERAVKYAQAWTRLISATLPDGTVLNESELRRRYDQHNSLRPHTHTLLQTATPETEICGQRLSRRAANEPRRRSERLSRLTAAPVSRRNVALFCGRGNHVGTRGLAGGAEGIRTDGHRGRARRRSVTSSI